MRYVFLAALCSLCMLLHAQKKKTPAGVDHFAGLDTAFERVLKDWHGAGFAVAVVKKDSVLYAKGFGYSDVSRKTPVTVNTLFPIGSCTKAFTVFLIGLLDKDGKVDIDKPVRNYLPEFRFYNETLNSSVTIRDMMSHRTGLPRHDFAWYAFPTHSRDSLVKRIQYLQPNTGLREKWQYNNFMYLLQGAVIEKLTGNSWENNIREKIFKPLHMSSSNLSIEDLEKSPDHSLGYDVRKDSIIRKMDYYHIDAMGPAGSINSNVTDMANWLKLWINGGRFAGKELIPAESLREAISSQMVANAGIPSSEKPDIQFINYGLGWMLGSYKGHYRVQHGGNIDGFSATACFFPTDSIGIVVLTNQNNSTITSVVQNLLADRMLGLPYFDWNTDLKKAADKSKAAVKEAEKTMAGNRKPNTTPSHNIKDYDGIYSHPGYGDMDIALVNDSLFTRIGNNVFWLRHYHYDIFEPVLKDPDDGIDTSARSQFRFRFLMNDAGDISSVSSVMEPTLPAVTFTKKARVKSVSVSELQQYTGEYHLGGVICKVYIKDATLYVLVPGQPDYELASVGNHRFTLKAVNGYFVQFELNDKNETTALTFVQPNGNFRAVKKTKP